jgi:hypothetical protein
MKFKLLSLVLLTFLSVPLRAQQGGGITMKIDFVAWGDEIKGLSLDPGAVKSGITALGFRYSTPVSYSGPVVMAIYQSAGSSASPAAKASFEELPSNLRPTIVEKPSSPGKEAAPKQGLALELEKRRIKEPTLVALAALPAAGCRRATVLLAPADGGTFTAYVIDDDPSRLPVGQLRIHNLSPVRIALRCNESPVKELDTRESMIVPAKMDHVIYELAYKLDDEWKKQENNVVKVRPMEQSQMIILKSNHSYFLASDGSASGFLQMVTLRRSPDAR